MGQVLHGNATTTEAVRRAIQHSQERLRVLAKRHGIKATDVASAVDGTSSIFAAVERLRGQGKTLVSYEGPEINSAEEFLADNEILDPDKAGGFFEPLGNRGLFHSKSRLKAPRATTD